MKFINTLYLTALLTFGCTTNEKTESYLEAISRSSSQTNLNTQTYTQIRVNPQKNLTQRVKEI